MLLHDPDRLWIVDYDDAETHGSIHPCEGKESRGSHEGSAASGIYGRTKTRRRECVGVVGDGGLGLLERRSGVLCSGQTLHEVSKLVPSRRSFSHGEQRATALAYKSNVSDLTPHAFERVCNRFIAHHRSHQHS